MAKIRMAQVAGLPVRTLRRMVGIPAHRPSAFNACIGASLKGKTYPTPPVGTGGQQDKRIQSAFTSAARACAGKRA
ncbi:hypothetical protein ES703_122373 [subsurface metagenome]